jgi:hypothetical protein
MEPTNKYTPSAVNSYDDGELVLRSISTDSLGEHFAGFAIWRDHAAALSAEILGH